MLRAFAADSLWNLPCTTAPVQQAGKRADGSTIYSSQDIIDWLLHHSPEPYPVVSGADGTWRPPVYIASATDKRYKVTQTKYALPSAMESPGVRIPSGARPDTTSDAEMVVWDPTDGTVYGLWTARYDTTFGTWSAGGGDLWATDSNGLDAKLGMPGTDPLNGGHRGFPSSALMIRYDEVAAGKIEHAVRIACTSTAPRHLWPMVGDEGGAGIIPEGTHLRLRPFDTSKLPSGVRVLVECLQTYGGYVVDQGGHFATGVENLEVENTTPYGRGLHWSSLGISFRCLAGIAPISLFEVVAESWRPSYMALCTALLAEADGTSYRCIRVAHADDGTSSRGHGWR